MSKRNAKKAAKAARKHPKLFITLAVIVIIVVIAALAVMYVKKIGPFKVQVPPDPPAIEGNEAEIVSAELSIHFLEL